MDEEALWTIEFEAALGWGRGVVVFETERLFGGDTDYIYTGKYEKHHGGKMVCEVQVTNYSGRLNSVVGNAREFNLHLEATVPQNISIGAVMRAEGHVVEKPSLKITMALTKRAILP